LIDHQQQISDIVLCGIGRLLPESVKMIEVAQANMGNFAEIGYSNIHGFASGLAAGRSLAYRSSAV
jgi:hypothetical protein